MRVAPMPPAGEHGDTTEACTFNGLDADFVRTFEGTFLPFYQELRAKHPHALKPLTITFAEVVRGEHVESTLCVSHRWMKPDQPECAPEPRVARKNNSDPIGFVGWSLSRASLRGRGGSRGERASRAGRPRRTRRRRRSGSALGRVSRASRNERGFVPG